MYGESAAAVEAERLREEERRERNERAVRWATEQGPATTRSIGYAQQLPGEPMRQESGWVMQKSPSAAEDMPTTSEVDAASSSMKPAEFKTSMMSRCCHVQ